MAANTSQKISFGAPAGTSNACLQTIAFVVAGARYEFQSLNRISRPSGCHFAIRSDKLPEVLFKTTAPARELRL